MWSEVFSLAGLGLALLVCVCFGTLFVQCLLPTSTFNKKLGLGVLIGTSFSGLLSLGLVMLNIDGRWAVVVTAALCMLILLFKVQSCDLHVRSNEISSASGQLLRAVAISLVGINGTSLPTIAIGLSLLLLPQTGMFEINHVVARRVLTGVISAAGIALGWNLAHFQPEWQFSDSNDGPFFEALSWTLAHFGLNTHPGYLDGDMRGYHVLAYLVPGFLSLVSDATPFFSLTIVVPLLSAFSISTLLLGDSKQSTATLRTQTLLVLVYVWMMGRGLVASAAFGSWALVAYSVALLETWERPACRSISKSTVQREVLLGSLGATAVLAKGPALGVVILLGVAQLFLNTNLSTIRSKTAIVRNLPFHLLVVVSIAALWYSQAGEMLARRDLSPIRKVLSMGLIDGLWDSRDLLEFGPLLLSIGLLALYALAVVPLGDHLHRPVNLLAAVSLGSVALVWLIPERVIRSNFLQHSYFVCLALTVLIAPLLPTAGGKIGFSRVVIVSAPATALASFFAVFQLENLLSTQTWKSRWIPELLTSSRLPVLLLLPLAMISVIQIYESRRRTVADRLSTRLWVLPTIVVSLGIFLFQLRIEQTWAPLFETARSEARPWSRASPDRDTVEVGNWIRENTETSSLLASNSFCCWNDPEFLENAQNQLKDVDSWWTKYGEDTWAGSNYLLPSVAHRRFLLAGPKFIITGIRDTTQIQNYLDISVRFGSEYSIDVANTLRKLGVDFFIADKSVSGTVSSKFLIVYQNDRYTIYQL